MSGRERNLLILLIGAVFIVANLAAFKMFYQPRMLEAESRLVTAEADLAANESAIENMDEFAAEIDWLSKYEPKESSTIQQSQTALQQLVEREAERNGLEKKRPLKLLPSVEAPGLHYHRARIEIEVTGMEPALYRWLDRLHAPNEFRAITSMRLVPEKGGDDTRVDCNVVVEQWFIPESTDI